MIRFLSSGIFGFRKRFEGMSVRMKAVVVLFTLSMLLAVVVIRRIFVHKRLTFDQKVFGFLNNHVNDRNNAIMKFFTFLGTHQFLMPANLTLISYYLFVRKEKWNSIKIPTIALSSLGLMFLLKYIFHRERPHDPLLFEAAGLSFPSGHALMSVNFYGLLIYIIFKNIDNKEAKWSLTAVLLLLILVIGFSRVYLRVHYASDVIAGYCIGLMWLVGMVWGMNGLEKYLRITNYDLQFLPRLQRSY